MTRAAEPDRPHDSVRPAADPGPLDRYGLPPIGSAPWHLRPPLVLLHGYKRLISPLLPSVCRHQPTCSQYSAQAYRVHGLWRGTFLTIGRLLRCHPFSAGGSDPVPPRRAPRR